MRKTVFALMVLFSCGALAAPPMEPGRNEPSPHMLKAMPMGPVGRYQMIRLVKGDQSRAAVMILDTANGHLWEWQETTTAKGSEGRAAITYLGRLEPGAKPGEVIESYRLPAP